MKAMILDGTEDIYKQLRVHEMKIINVAEGDQKKDSAGAFISQMMG